MPSKKVRPKVRGKRDVYDEWEHSDIDRDEQKRGLERRARRWKEIEIENKRQAALNEKAIDEIEKKDRGTKNRQPTELEKAWLRCDFLLAQIMVPKAYEFMEWQRINDPDTYKRLYRKFMSKNMMAYAEQYIDYFLSEKKAPKMVSFPEMIKQYKKIKGIKSKTTIVRKGQEDIVF